MEHLQYPIGRNKSYLSYNEKAIKEHINEIETLPALFSGVAKSLTKEQLHKPYRPEGWTGIQVIHHVADSHLNAFIRFKWTLTENEPTIKPYAEAMWAKLPDGNLEDISLSLDLLTALHKRWVVLLKSLSEADLNRNYFHPEYNKKVALYNAVSTYAWHGKHHMAHLNLLKA